MKRHLPEPRERTESQNSSEKTCIHTVMPYYTTAPKFEDGSHIHQ